MNGVFLPLTGAKSGSGVGYVLMRAPLPPVSRTIFLRAAALLAMVAQFAVGVAALGEARAGLGYASHIDPSGTSTHYAHDEAVCAACQARSLHGVVRLPHPPLVIAPRRELAAIAAPESRHDSGAHAQHLSRAPPALS